VRGSLSRRRDRRAAKRLPRAHGQRDRGSVSAVRRGRMSMSRIHLILIGALATACCNLYKSDLLGDGSSDAATMPDDAATAAASYAFPMEMLVANYEFDDGSGTVATETVRGLHGMLSDPSMWTTMGRHGGAIAMNGANPATQYVALPN